MLFQIDLDIIRYMLTFIIFFGIKYCSTDISGFSDANEGVLGGVSHPK